MCSPCSGRFFVGSLLFLREQVLVDGENHTVIGEAAEGVADTGGAHHQELLVLSSVQRGGVGESHQSGVLHCCQVVRLTVLELLLSGDVTQLDGTSNEPLNIALLEKLRGLHSNSVVGHLFLPHNTLYL